MVESESCDLLHILIIFRKNKNMKNLDDIFYKSEPESESLYYLVNRGYRECQNQDQKDVLFVGLNPPEDEYRLEPTFDFYDVLDSFFIKLRKFIKTEAGLDVNDCAYTDLFYFRQTQYDKFWINEYDKECKSFLIEQLVYTEHKIREIIKPKVIVVLNSDAADYMGLEDNYRNESKSWMGYKCDWNRDLGCYVLKEINSDIPEIGSIPVQREIYILPASFLSLRSKHIKKLLGWQINRLVRMAKSNLGEV